MAPIKFNAKRKRVFKPGQRRIPKPGKLLLRLRKRREIRALLQTLQQAARLDSRSPSEDIPSPDIVEPPQNSSTSHDPGLLAAQLGLKAFAHEALAAVLKIRLNVAMNEITQLLASTKSVEDQLIDLLDDISRMETKYADGEGSKNEQTRGLDNDEDGDSSNAEEDDQNLESEDKENEQNSESDTEHEEGNGQEEEDEEMESGEETTEEEY